jgi:hypothetical protein
VQSLGNTRLIELSLPICRGARSYTMRAAVVLVVLLCLVMTIAALPRKLNSETDSDGQGAFNILEVVEGKVQMNLPASAEANPTCVGKGWFCLDDSSCCSGVCDRLFKCE